MAENLCVPTGVERDEMYRIIIPQIKNLFEGESDTIACMANLSAVLREAFGFLWVGFYVVRGEDLVLGPFQGSVACARIARGRGVCGAAWERGQTIIVADVDLFEGHIACSSASRSEIVVPVFRNGAVVAVLDVDSDMLNDFSQTDALFLEQIVSMLKL